MTQRRAKPDLYTLKLPAAEVTREEIQTLDPREHPRNKEVIGGDLQALAQALYVTMRMREHKLVEKAFDAAMGWPDPHPKSSREQLIEMLTEDYLHFGLATGRHHTEQCVRTFEAQAVEQAKAHLGSGRE